MQADAGPHDPPRNLALRFAAACRAGPRRTALRHGERSWRYEELGEVAARTAGWLRDRDLSSGARVGVLGERGAPAFAGILGCAWAGAAFVPLRAADPPARTAERMDRARLDALLVDAAGARLVLGALADAASVPVLQLAGDAPGALARIEAAHLEEPAPVHGEDAAYLLFTSGSTGPPKGVAATVANLDHLLGVARQRFALSPGERVSSFFEPTFDLFLFDLFATWSAGACLVVVPDAARMAPVELVREQELDVWFSVPSALSLAARTGSLRPGSMPSLRLSLFCGEPLPAETARAWQRAAPGSRLENLYGPTEATLFCLAEDCKGGVRETPDLGTVPIGRPLPGTLARVVDDELREVADGQEGELLLGGPQVVPGYDGDAELTARRFVELEGRRWYRSGDRARRDADGTFHFLGRGDQQVKVRGHRVELGEIEAHLREAAGVAAVAAVAFGVHHGSAAGIAAFVAGSPVAPELLRERLARVLPEHALPRRLTFLDELPRGAHGKLDRAELERRAGEGR